MTKKHFIELADAIRRFNADYIGRAHYNDSPAFTDAQISALADFCQSQNPDFKRDRWLGYIAGTNGKLGGAGERSRIGGIMQEAKHTPTPWELGTNGDNCARNHAICGGNSVIAKVYGKGYPAGKGWSAESEADARFIVTAVNAHEEMLAALQRVTKWLIRCAEADEERAKDTRFITLSEACTADAKNYRATAKDLQGAIDKALGK